MAVPLDSKPSRPLGRHSITLGRRSLATFGSAAGEVEAAASALASALPSIANEDIRNAEVLKRAALERMALDYKDRLGGLAADVASFQQPNWVGQPGEPGLPTPVPPLRQNVGIFQAGGPPRPVHGCHFATGPSRGRFAVGHPSVGPRRRPARNRLNL